MVKFQKYKFRKYRKDYPLLFLKEKRKLMKILPKEAIIEHIGSTAIPGLGGKGMIDITIVVPKNKINLCMKKLQNKGFIYKPKSPDNQRKYLEKRIIYNQIERRVHLHLTYKNSQIYRNFILFRDYLRKNKKIAEEYANVKKKALIYAKGNGKLYLIYKQKFINKIINRAKKVK